MQPYLVGLSIFYISLFFHFGDQKFCFSFSTGTVVHSIFLTCLTLYSHREEDRYGNQSGEVGEQDGQMSEAVLKVVLLA